MESGDSVPAAATEFFAVVLRELSQRVFQRFVCDIQDAEDGNSLPPASRASVSCQIFSASAGFLRLQFLASDGAGKVGHLLEERK